MQKTVAMLHRLDPSIPTDLADRTRLCLRDDYFGGGYAVSDDVTSSARAASDGPVLTTLRV